RGEVVEAAVGAGEDNEADVGVAKHGELLRLLLQPGEPSFRKQFLGKISWKAPKSSGNGSLTTKSPLLRGAGNGREVERLSMSSPPPPHVATVEGAETREDVFLRKLNVCCVVFDFSVAEL
ncbi:hypothetical protein E2562_015877, partial [Oryza meyeriana var. granulata]